MNKFTKVLFSVMMLLSAVALVVAGIGVIANYGSVMEGIAVWIGIVMMVSGVLQLGGAAMLRGSVFGGHSFLTKGAAALVVGLLLVCQNFVAGGVIQVIFSVMLIVDAVSMLGVATEKRFKALNLPVKRIMWPVAIIELVIGICGFIKPEVLHIALGVIIGISLIYEGLSITYTWFLAWKTR